MVPGRSRQRAARHALSPLVALLVLVALTASPALAVTWGRDVKLSSTSTANHELEVTGPASAIAVWLRGFSIVARRTVDGGTTWLPSQTLATDADGLAIGVASSGARVDLVYVRRVTCAATGEAATRLYLRQSANGGATWAAPRAITSACSQVVEPDVARSGDGQVSIVWTGLLTGRILITTSRDGGATFGAAIHLASTSVRDFDTVPGAGNCCYTAQPAVAIGSAGTTYVAYTAAQETQSVRRSTNRGATWSVATRLSGDAITHRPSLVADGARAIVGYDVQPFNAVYRTTTNRGTTWSSQRQIVGVDAGEFSTRIRFAVAGGVLAATVKFGTPGRSPVWYRESLSWGATWGSTIRISPAPRRGLDPETAGLLLLDDQVLAAHAENGGIEGLWIRQGAR